METSNKLKYLPTCQPWVSFKDLSCFHKKTFILHIHCEMCHFNQNTIIVSPCSLESQHVHLFWMRMVLLHFSWNCNIHKGLVVVTDWRVFSFYRDNSNSEKRVFWRINIFPSNLTEKLCVMNCHFPAVFVSGWNIVLVYPPPKSDTNFWCSCWKYPLQYKRNCTIVFGVGASYA